MKISEQLAYAAGIVDGEGGFSITRTGDRFLAGLNVRMTTENTVRKVAGVLPGSMWFSEKENAWRFAAGGKKASEASERLLPYLLTKQKQAELVMQFWSHMQANSHRHFINPKEPNDLLSKRESFIEEIKRFNSSKHQVSWNDEILSPKSLYAYSAGLIDAEGSITMIKSGRGRLPAVLMQLTHPTAIERLVKLFGGHIHEEVRKTLKGKTVYSWRITASNALACCKRILPYLIQKRDQAELVIRFQTNVRCWNRRLGFGNKYVPTEVVSKRDRWFDEIHALNRRTAAAETNPRHSFERTDSPSLQDGKLQEPIRNDLALQAFDVL